MMNNKINYLLPFFFLITSPVVFANAKCLSGDEARDAFLSEKREAYFSLLQHREIVAKLGHAIDTGSLQQQRDIARVEYRKSVMECSAKEAAALSNYVTIIETNASALYPGLVSKPWHFVKVADAIEGGLPHTHGDTIVLSQSFLAAIQRSAERQQWNLNIITVLIHEQVHVIQRSMSSDFHTLYVKNWGFRNPESIKGGEAWMKQHQVVNPDGVDVNWVWQVPGSSRTIWPRLIFTDGHTAPMMPQDFRSIGIELTKTGDGYKVIIGKDGHPKYGDLHEEESYLQKFAFANSIYHPNEIAADYLSNLVVLDCLVDKNQIPADVMEKLENVYRPIRAWARKVFGPA